jgi:hypothetical protein
MASIFHQNMRVFGGGAAGRNAAFNGAFALINAACPTDVIAAGFTEITNWNAPLRGRLLTLSGVLDPGLTRVTVAAVGTSALGTQEYIGMTWDPNYFTVQYAGQVLYNNLQRAWVAHVVPAPIPLQIPALGGPFTAADQRGPAFLAGTYNGDELIVMFMHNMYGLGDRGRGFDGMPSAASAIQSTIGNPYDDAFVIAGGDYNLDPRFAGRKRSSDGTLRGMDFRAAMAGGNFVKTTVKNPYDFWLASDITNIPTAWATVRTESRIALASDHAAIRLKIG